MTNQEQMQAFIDAGKKATQGQWKTAEEMGEGDIPYIFSPDAENSIGPVIARFDYSRKDRDFILQSANSRPAISAMLEDNKELLQMSTKQALTIKELIDENERLKDLLETAKIGIEWYRAEHPDDASEADKELMVQIEQALEGRE